MGSGEADREGSAASSERLIAGAGRADMTYEMWCVVGELGEVDSGWVEAATGSADGVEWTKGRVVSCVDAGSAPLSRRAAAGRSTS